MSVYNTALTKYVDAHRDELVNFWTLPIRPIRLKSGTEWPADPVLQI